MDADGDPRVLDMYEFHDSIRWQYKCSTNRMRIAKLTVKIWPDDSAEGRRPKMWDVLTLDWDLLVDDLRTSSEQVGVKVRLRLL